MIGTITSSNHSSRNSAVIGVLLLASGLTMNYLFERHNIFVIWVNSPRSVSWLDGLYPPLCIFLSLAGIVLLVGAMRRTTIRHLLQYAFRIVIPLTVVYALFSLGIQFVATGADRLGECPGLYQAAASSNVIPESQWRPGLRALGCEVQRRGMFLSYYNVVGVHGVTDEAAQQRILDRVAEHFRQAHTHPVQVVFYEKEIWSVRQGKNGVTFGSGLPSKLIRVVNIG